MIFERADICIADLNPVQGAEQSGIRPVIVFQNNNISKIIIIPLTTNLRRAELPSCILISPESNGLNEKSVALCHQIRVIDRKRIIKKIGKINNNILFEIETTLLLTLGYYN